LILNGATPMQARISAGRALKLCMVVGNLILGWFFMCVAAAVPDDVTTAATPRVIGVEGTVVDENGRTVADAVIAGITATSANNRNSLSARSRPDGTFSASRLAVPWVLYGRSADSKQVGFANLAPEQENITVRLRPTASVCGRLVNHLGKVMSQGGVGASIQVYKPGQKDGTFPSWWNFANTSVASDGRYELSCLAPGQEYRITTTDLSRGRSWVLATIKPTNSGLIDLGDTRCREAVSLEERTAEVFRPRGRLDDRITIAQDESANACVRVLLFFGRSTSIAAQEMVGFCERNVSILDNYHLVPISTDDSGAMQEAQRRYGQGVASADESVLLVLDERGNLAGSKSLAAGSSEKRYAQEQAIKKFLIENASPQSDARTLLAEALDRAREQGKSVLLQETAPNCPECLAYAKFMRQHEAIFDEHFVTLRINRSRLKDGEEVMRQFRSGKPIGVPWIVALDGEGKPLRVFEGPNGERCSFPHKPESIDHFLEFLQTAATRMTDDQMATLRHGFETDK
jgi:hypothetical protein